MKVGDPCSTSERGSRACQLHGCGCAILVHGGGCAFHVVEAKNRKQKTAGLALDTPPTSQEEYSTKFKSHHVVRREVTASTSYPCQETNNRKTLSEVSKAHWSFQYIQERDLVNVGDVGVGYLLPHESIDKRN